MSNGFFSPLNQIILLPLKALGLPAARAETVWVKTPNPTGQHMAVHIAHLILALLLINQTLYLNFRRKMEKSILSVTL